MEQFATGVWLHEIRERISNPAAIGLSEYAYLAPSTPWVREYTEPFEARPHGYLNWTASTTVAGETYKYSMSAFPFDNPILAVEGVTGAGEGARLHTHVYMRRAALLITAAAGVPADAAKGMLNSLARRHLESHGWPAQGCDVLGLVLFSWEDQKSQFVIFDDPSSDDGQPCREEDTPPGLETI